MYLDALRDVFNYLVASSSIGTLALFTPLWAPWLIYSGIKPSASGSQETSSRSFTLAELACAFVYVGMANALFNAIRSEFTHIAAWRIAMPVICNALAVAMWFLSLQFANDKGLWHSSHRIWTILFFFPGASIAMAHAVASPLQVLVLWGGDEGWSIIFLIALLSPSSILACWALRVFFRRLIKRVALVEGSQ